MRKNYLTVALALFAVATFSSISFAKCDGSVNLPSEQTWVTFKKNDQSLDAAEVAKLKDWARQMRVKYPIHQWLSISARAQPDEDRPEDLATSRAVLVAKVALDSGLVRAPIELKTHVGSFGNPASYGEDARTATVQLSPGCPNNCCDGN
jgi:hypothetical protein